MLGVLLRSQHQKNLPDKVIMELEEGERIVIPVEYEWTPPLCNKCVNFGHVYTQCPATKVWRPKEKVPHTAAASGSGDNVEKATKFDVSATDKPKETPLPINSVIEEVNDEESSENELLNECQNIRDIKQKQV